MNDLTQQNSQPTLRGDIVELRPLEWHHRDALLAAVKDGELWNSKTTVVPSPETLDQYLATALDQREAQTAIPFVILKLDEKKIVGCTRFWKIDIPNRKLDTLG